MRMRKVVATNNQFLVIVIIAFLVLLWPVFCSDVYDRNCLPCIRAVRCENSATNVWRVLIWK